MPRGLLLRTMVYDCVLANEYCVMIPYKAAFPPSITVRYHQPNIGLQLLRIRSRCTTSSSHLLGPSWWRVWQVLILSLPRVTFRSLVRSFMTFVDIQWKSTDFQIGVTTGVNPTTGYRPPRRNINDLINDVPQW